MVLSVHSVGSSGVRLSPGHPEGLALTFCGGESYLLVCFYYKNFCLRNFTVGEAKTGGKKPTIEH